MARSRRGGSLGPIGCGLFALLAFAPTAPAQEAWDAVYIAGSKAGYIHLRVEPVNDKGRELRRIRYGAVLNVNRGKDPVSLEQQYGTIETPDGAVLKLETRVLLGPNVIRTYGEVVDDKMTLALDAGGQRQQQVIPWGPEIRGPYGAELSLSRQPIKPGETRSLKTFIPVLNKVCTTTLSAKGLEDVELGGGTKRSLLRIEGKLTDDKGAPIAEGNTTYWVDAAGQILKSYTDVFGGQVTYRTTREAATAPAGAKLDLIQLTIIKVTHKIPKPEATRHVFYRVKIKDDDPTQVFPSDRRQTLKRSGDSTDATLEVRTAGRNDGPPGPARVADEYLRDNTQVNSADPKVVELMRKAVGNQADPWAKAVAIARWVNKNMAKKNFETAFATASEVAQTLSGDCTEHSVLTAAMCRAAGIPARVAVGLVYVDSFGGFGFHMWNEVHVNRRWVAIDPTFDEIDVDAVHIKMSDSSLDGVSPYESFTSVVRVSNKTTLEPVEIRSQ